MGDVGSRERPKGDTQMTSTTQTTLTFSMKYSVAERFFTQKGITPTRAQVAAHICKSLHVETVDTSFVDERVEQCRQNGYDLVPMLGNNAEAA